MRKWLTISVLLFARLSWAAPATCNIWAFTGVAELQLNTFRFLNLGDVFRPTFSFGADGITNGTKGIIDRVRWDLNCLTQNLPCVPAEMVVVYDGDETITSTCGGPLGEPVTWRTNNIPGQPVNEIVFTANPPLEMPAGATEFCKLGFNAHVEQLPSNGVQAILTVGGFRPGDAHCDNGIGNRWTDPLPVWELCPLCVPGSVCNQQIGVCEMIPPPTPVAAPARIIVSVGSQVPPPSEVPCVTYGDGLCIVERCADNLVRRVCP